MTKLRLPPLRVGDLIRQLDQFDHDAVVLVESKGGRLAPVNAVTRRRVCSVSLTGSDRPLWVAHPPVNPGAAEMIEELTEGIAAVVLGYPK